MTLKMTSMNRGEPGPPEVGSTDVGPVGHPAAASDENTKATVAGRGAEPELGSHEQVDGPPAAAGDDPPAGEVGPEDLMAMRRQRDEMRRQLLDLRRDIRMQEVLAEAGCPRDRMKIIQGAYLGLHPELAGGSSEASVNDEDEATQAAELTRSFREFVATNRWLVQAPPPSVASQSPSGGGAAVLPLAHEGDASAAVRQVPAGPPNPSPAAGSDGSVGGPAAGSGTSEFARMNMSRLQKSYAEAIAAYREQPSNTARQRVLHLRQELRAAGLAG